MTAGHRGLVEALQACISGKVTLADGIPDARLEIVVGRRTFRCWSNPTRSIVSWATSSRSRLPRPTRARRSSCSTLVDRGLRCRFNDQFNTTVYGNTDRVRGIHGSRMIVMINREDRTRFGIPQAGTVRMTTAVDDGITRSMGGFQTIDYNIPPGTPAAYYPECNALIPLWQFAQESKTPAAKSVPVRITPE